MVVEPQRDSGRTLDLLMFLFFKCGSWARKGPVGRHILALDRGGTWWNHGGTVVEPWWNRLQFWWNRGLVMVCHHVFLYIFRVRDPDRLPPI